MAIGGDIRLPKMDGEEISPGIFLIGEPSPVPGTDKLRCLAQVGRALCVVELALTFSQVSR